MEKLDHAGQQYFNITEKDALSMGIPQSVVDLAASKQEHSNVSEARRKAYLVESDPLYMEWQYDQTAEKEQAWRDKVAEIKARYPLPSES
ncbi:TPA: hypothetical protein GRR52_23690 [Vibrio parahaemolyticus]|nr:hypothetical protein [Vibrio parahaemolyticus]